MNAGMTPGINEPETARKMAETIDVVVVGRGPAGLQAAVYLSRAKHSVTVVGNSGDSGLKLAHAIENYFGVESQSGGQLLAAGERQAAKFGSKLVDGEVVKIARREGGFTVETSSGGKLACKAIIICSGSKRASAGVAGEEEYVGKGVSYCAACDAWFFKKKPVAVVGAGDYACHEALELARHASKVTVFTQGKPLAASESSKKLLKEKGIELRRDTVVALEGAPFLTRVRCRKQDGSEYDAECNGLFVAVGTAGSASLATLAGAEVEGSFVKIDAEGKTTAPGVFAAGDCTGGRMQLATSVGQGANAAFAAMEFLRGAVVKVDWGNK
ncbi:MAG: NAD(P)/FAD-dependent oxidoreductase [Candidatus Micrarchaeota archaeon]